MAFTDVYDSSEIVVEVGQYDTDSWNYTTIAYRRSLSIDKPDNTRNVHDKLSFKGKKLTRGDNTLGISQEFQGFGEGIEQFQQANGLIVKVSVQPHDGSTPNEPVHYFTNWCTIPLSYGEFSDEGEVDVTLEGNFDEEITEEPANDSF
jgi:hypothetical protein